MHALHTFSAWGCTRLHVQWRESVILLLHPMSFSCCTKLYVVTLERLQTLLFCCWTAKYCTAMPNIVVQNILSSSFHRRPLSSANVIISTLRSPSITPPADPTHPIQFIHLFDPVLHPSEKAFLKSARSSEERTSVGERDISTCECVQANEDWTQSWEMRWFSMSVLMRVRVCALQTRTWSYQMREV